MTETKLSHKTRRISNPANRADGQAGFTLLELLVVIVILGLLIGLVAPAVLRQLGHAKESIARQSIVRIGTVLDIYKLDVGAYPSTQDGLQALITKPDDVQSWAGPYIKSSDLPLDPWGHLCSLGSADKPGQPGDPGLTCNQ
jgi:general secretion pathway protein G